MKKKVIVVTDGDSIAKAAVELAAKNIGGRCISLSAGNPTALSGYEIIRLIELAENDPVVVMVDDRGNIGMGSGERVLSCIRHSDDVELIGVVAVASNSPMARGVKVDCSIDRDGFIVSSAVDKYGNTEKSKLLKGDTVNSLSDMNIPYIVGIGDPGKMDGNDTIEKSAPVLTKALTEIISNYNKC